MSLDDSSNNNTDGSSEMLIATTSIDLTAKIWKVHKTDVGG
jgi:hypothetical protein